MFCFSLVSNYNLLVPINDLLKKTEQFIVGSIQEEEVGKSLWWHTIWHIKTTTFSSVVY